MHDACSTFQYYHFISVFCCQDTYTSETRRSELYWKYFCNNTLYLLFQKWTTAASIIKTAIAIAKNRRQAVVKVCRWTDKWSQGWEYRSRYIDISIIFTRCDSRRYSPFPKFKNNCAVSYLNAKVTFLISYFKWHHSVPAFLRLKHVQWRNRPCFGLDEQETCSFCSFEEHTSRHTHLTPGEAESTVK